MKKPQLKLYPADGMWSYDHHGQRFATFFPQKCNATFVCAAVQALNPGFFVSLKAQK